MRHVPRDARSKQAPLRLLYGVNFLPSFLPLSVYCRERNEFPGIAPKGAYAIGRWPSLPDKRFHYTSSAPSKRAAMLPAQGVLQHWGALVLVLLFSVSLAATRACAA